MRKPFLLAGFWLLMITSQLTLLAQEIQMGIPTETDYQEYFRQEQWEKCYPVLRPLFQMQPELYQKDFLEVLWRLNKTEELTSTLNLLQKQFSETSAAWAYQIRWHHKQGIQGRKQKQLERNLIQQYQNNPDALRECIGYLSQWALYDEGLNLIALFSNNSIRSQLILDEADLLYKKGEVASMIQRYLDAAEQAWLPWVEIYQRFQTCLGYDDQQGGFKNPILIQEVAQRVQKNPQNRTLQEFLQFLYLNRGDLEPALKHAASLDRRYEENGIRFMAVADAAAIAQNQQVLEQAYALIIKKGISHPYYFNAYQALISKDIKNITTNAQLSKKTLDSIEIILQDLTLKCADPANKVAFQELRTQLWWNMDRDVALAISDSLLQWSFLNTLLKAEHKLKHGELLLKNNQLWEARLCFGQIEKEHKYEVVAQDAKYKSALLSFYQGDFVWAKTQADILKGATSKRISNDAVSLSLLIGDALALDSNEAPLRMFSKAQLFEIQGHYDWALLTYDSVNSQFNEHTLADDVLYSKAKTYLQLGRNKEALTVLEQIGQYYSDQLYGDDALWQRIQILLQLNSSDTRVKALAQELIIQYPASLYVPQAQAILLATETLRPAP